MEHILTPKPVSRPKAHHRQTAINAMKSRACALALKNNHPNRQLAKGLCLYMENLLKASGKPTKLQGKLGKIQTSSDLQIFCEKHEDLACELIGRLSDKDHDIVCSKLSLVLYDLLHEEGLL